VTAENPRSWQILIVWLEWRIAIFPQFIAKSEQWLAIWLSQLIFVIHRHLASQAYLAWGLSWNDRTWSDYVKLVLTAAARNDQPLIQYFCIWAKTFELFHYWSY